MKKVLFVATVTAHINGFHIPYLKWFKDNGYEVHIASNGTEEILYCDKHFQLPFTRNPLSIGNIKAYNRLKEIIKNNSYEIIHCHTPVGGVLTRLAVKNNKINTKVIYTAHGFHFYKHAPIFNWMIYYPIEKYLSKYTDYLITINKEDFNRAKNKLKTENIYLINGVGVKKSKFDFKLSENDKIRYVKEFELENNQYIFLNVGELNKNKNQIMQIKAIRLLTKKYKNIKLLIAGKGPLKSYYEKMIKKYNLEENIKLIGYRKDIPKLLKLSNCLLATSKREGLPVNVIEAEFCSKKIIATNIRGQRDLVSSDNLIEINDISKLATKMENAIKNSNEIIIYDIEKFELNNVIKNITEIYKEIIMENEYKK